MLTFMRTMKRLVNEFNRERNRRMSHYNLTSSQVDVLIILLRAGEGEEVYPGTVQRELKLSCPTVNGLLNRLEQKGFLYLENSARDRRKKRIVLTEKGRNTNQILSQLGLEWEKRATVNFSDAELLVLGQLLKKLELNATQMPPELSPDAESKPDLCR